MAAFTAWLPGYLARVPQPPHPEYGGYRDLLLGHAGDDLAGLPWVLGQAAGVLSAGHHPDDLARDAARPLGGWLGDPFVPRPREAAAGGGCPVRSLAADLVAAADFLADVPAVPGEAAVGAADWAVDGAVAAVRAGIDADELAAAAARLSARLARSGLARSGLA